MSLALFIVFCVAVFLALVAACFVYVKATTPLDRLTGRDWRLTGLAFAPVFILCAWIMVAG